MPPPAGMIEAGDVIDEPCQPGHHETIETPNTCLCCGLVYYYREPLCICAQGGNYWLQDELRRVSCFFHAQEKMKDGLFGALSGDFTVPGGQPTRKPYREGMASPVVRSEKVRPPRPTRRR